MHSLSQSGRGRLGSPIAKDITFRGSYSSVQSPNGVELVHGTG